VALATSVRLRRVSRRQVFRFAFHFGLFQALMPFIGWLAGRLVEDFVRSWAHWIALALLAGVGLRTICEALGRAPEHEGDVRDPTRGWSLVVLSVATSIDALAVGLSFAFLELDVGFTCLMIGLVTAGLTFIGMVFGTRLGNRFGGRLEVLGGLLLIAIGLKIALTHG
jgi:putative Mn2+ efflux pump MntP